MDEKVSFDKITQIIGKLFLESQLEIVRLSNEILKLRQEKEQALSLLGKVKDEPI